MPIYLFNVWCGLVAAGYLSVAAYAALLMPRTPIKGSDDDRR